jgi:phage terminase Nu1 subunit (DNA packaging protein)
MAVKSNTGLMPQAEYARYRKVNRSYINRLAKRGILVVRGKLVDVAASDAVLDDRPVDFEARQSTGGAETRLPAEGGAGAGVPPTSFAQARTAEMIFRARLRKLEYETKSGKLIPADEVKVQWFKLGRQIRDKLLAMPAKLAPQLAALGEVRAVRELLDVEIEAILRGLQDDIRYRRP